MAAIFAYKSSEGYLRNPCYFPSRISGDYGRRLSTKLIYSCKTHGAFRSYSSEISASVLKISLILLTGMIPFYIIYTETEVNFQLFLVHFCKQDLLRNLILIS